MAKAELVKSDDTAVVTQSGSDGAVILSMIDKIMAAPDVPIERVERMFDLYRRTQDEQAKKEFAVALNGCQSAMAPVSKDASNSQTKSKYATYGKLDMALRPIYSAHGFSLSFNTGKTEKTDSVRVLAYLTHVSGHEREYELDMPADGKGAKGGDVMTKTHATGAGVKYGRRYLLEMIFNIATTDDDGNGAGAQQHTMITSDQIAELHNLLEETNTDLAKFLQLGGIDCITEFNSLGFEKAKSFLLTKKKKKLEAKQ